MYSQLWELVTALLAILCWGLWPPSVGELPYPVQWFCLAAGFVAGWAGCWAFVARMTPSRSSRIHHSEVEGDARLERALSLGGEGNAAHLDEQ